MNNIANIGHMFNALNHKLVQLNMEMETIKRDMDTFRPQSVTDVNESTHVDTNDAFEELRKELSDKVSKTELETVQTSIKSLATEIAKLAMVTSLFPRVSALETKEAERSLLPRPLKAEDVHRMIAEYFSSTIPAETFKVDIQLPSTTETSTLQEPKPEQMQEEVVEQVTPVVVTTKASKGTRGRGRGSKKTLNV